MKRQATISSYFPSKKPKQEETSKENQTQAVDMTEKFTELSTEDRKRLHEQFVERFGAIEEKRQNKRQRVSEPSQQKLSPLEVQVTDLKARYPDCLLLIEVGYKFRFFGEDAKIASRVLHIANMVDRNFYVASIPVHRLSVHVQKLVDAGYKVGIVRQTETAALKAIGSNKNQVFERKLTQVVTKGTLVDEMYEPVMTHNSGYLMCLIEEKRGGSGADEFVHIGMVAVHPSTGDIVYDTFDDAFMRNELETRLIHIEPSEILVSQIISAPTQKLIRHFTVGEGAVRIEKMPSSDNFCTDYNAAMTYVSEFYSECERAKVLSTVMELPGIIIKALAALIRYLKEFGLSSMFHVGKYIKNFVSKSHMLLNANTLVNLEVYRNSTNYKEEGSLFSVLNHTQTKFGQRLLKRWVGRPLTDIEKLNERVDAIEELMMTDNPKKNKLVGLLKKLPDIEKGVCRIHYGKSSPTELVHVLDALAAVSTLFNNDIEPRFQSEMLNRLFDTLSTIRKDILEYKKMIHPQHASDKTKFLKSEERWPDIPREKNNIKFVESLLHEHLEEMKAATGLSDLRYVEVAGVEFLLEVANTKTKSVPVDWIKISGTKAVSRFHSRYIIQQLKEREQHRERLGLLVDQAYKDLLADISGKYESFRDIVSCLAQLDCLLSLSVASSQPAYVKPIYKEERSICVKNGRHPIVEKLTTYVPNDIYFENTQTTMILTGPNMGGKSSYIRQVALICMMGQIGLYVPAESATLCMLDAIYTRMGASDNMIKGESTFMVELHETSDIMKHATSRSLVILDELGRGTSTHDGQAIAYATLQYFIEQIQSITLFVTHYPSMSQFTTLYPNHANNYYMDYIEEMNHDDDIPNIVFLYKLRQGVNTKSYGMNVAKLANIPIDIIKRAKEISNSLQKDIEQRRQRKRQVSLLKKLLSNENSFAIK